MPPKNGSFYTDNEFGYFDPELAKQLNVTEGYWQGMIQPSGTIILSTQPAPGKNPYPPVPAASGPGAATAFTGVPMGAGAGAAAANPLLDPFAGASLSLPTGTSALCDLLPEAARAACKATLGLFPTPTPTTTGVKCPTGYHPSGNPSAPCAIDGVGTYLPGDVGKPDYVFNATVGRFGQGATPVRVQMVKLSCPSGMKLGKDNVCYDHIARGNRKWNPGAKPLLTGGDMNAINKTKRLEKRWRKVAPAFHKKVVSSGAKLIKARRGK